MNTTTGTTYQVTIEKGLSKAQFNSRVAQIRTLSNKTYAGGTWTVEVTTDKDERTMQKLADWGGVDITTGTTESWY